MQTDLFHQTTTMTNEQLSEAIKTASNQQDVVFAIYQAKKVLTAEETLHLYVHNTGKRLTPITSIRRSITNLYNSGKLEKLERIRISSLGRPEHYYRIKN